MPDRLPIAGPSFVLEHEVRVGDDSFLAGMMRPTSTEDGWWLSIMWVRDAREIVPFRALGPRSGPPPVPPAARIGAAMANGLAGLILEEAGRLSIQVAPVAPGDDPNRPWTAPAAVRVAIKFEPARAATMQPDELADVALAAFRRAAESLNRP